MSETRGFMGGVLAGIASIAVATALGGAAFAQQNEADENAVKWLVNCTNTASDGALECSMSQSVFVAESGQRLLSMRINKTQGSDQLAMLLTLPFGLYLPAGATLSVDGDAVEELPIQTCDPNGCYAGLEITGKVLDRFRRGVDLAVTVQNLEREDITIDGTLQGFSAAHSRLL